MSHHQTLDCDDCSTDYTAQRHHTALLYLAWKKHVHHSYKLLIDMLSAYPECLKVSCRPATIAPINLVMMVLLDNNNGGSEGSWCHDSSSRGSRWWWCGDDITAVFGVVNKLWFYLFLLGFA
jgi:hypothetical protein